MLLCVWFQRCQHYPNLVAAGVRIDSTHSTSIRPSLGPRLRMLSLASHNRIISTHIAPLRKMLSWFTIDRDLCCPVSLWFPTDIMYHNMAPRRSGPVDIARYRVGIHGPSTYCDVNIKWEKLGTRTYSTLPVQFCEGEITPPWRCSVRMPSLSSPQVVSNRKMHPVANLHCTWSSSGIESRKLTLAWICGWTQ